MKRSSNLPLSDLVTEYLTDGRLRRLSQNTLDSYAWTLKDFQARTGILRLGQVTPDMVKAYQAQRGAALEAYAGSWHPTENRPVTPGTLHLIARNLRAFGRWLHRQGHSNPFAVLIMPKLEKVIVEPLTAEEIQALFSCWGDESAFALRWQAILSFMLDTGVRVGELVSLTLDNLDMQNYRAKVRGKGSRERYVFFGNRTHRLTSRYLHEGRNDVSPRVFVSLDGEAMTTNGVQQIIKRAKKKTGIERLHAHLFRHTFASAYVQRNAGDVFGLQQLLGHSSLGISQQYVHLAQVTSIQSTRRVSLLDDLEGQETLSFRRRRGQKRV